MKTRKWLAAPVGLLVALVAAALIVPVASAHHPVLDVTLDCNGKVSYTVWADELNATRNNNDVRVFDDAPALVHQVGSGAFNAANNWQFSGSYTVSTSVNSVTLTPVAYGVWGNPSAQHPAQGPSATATRPNTCKKSSSTVTTIHSAAHAAVTTVAVGSTVHDSVVVSGNSGTPTGNVTFDWFTNGTCTGSPASSSGNVALSSGSADATGFAKTVSSAGSYGFLAHYLGDNKYSPSDGVCEPLRVVDANIQIGPATATNRIGDTHVFTAQVNVNDGTGFANAPNGTLITITKDSGPGTLAAGSCTTAGGTGSCSVNLDSNATGIATVSANTTVLVNGVSLTRNTDGVGANSAPAVKIWANAKITIAPDATNRIGESHTFNVTLWKDTGTGVFVPAAGEHVTVTLTDSNGAVHTAPTGSCTTAGANTDANGQCSITFTSNTTGKVTAHGASTLSVAGSAPFTVQTDQLLLSSGDAVKTFINAKIAIAPDATNDIGQSHTFTVTLMKDTGTGTFVAAAGEHVNVTLTDSNGAVHTAPTGTCTTAGANTNASGQCTITFTSQTAGKVTAHASSTLAVGASAPFTIATDGTGLNSADVVKTFVDANIQITPLTAVNPVGAPHVFTGHVNVNTGSGGFANAPNGTQISFTIDSGPGSFTSANPCITSGGTGSCTITLVSATPGATVVSAHVTTLVGGLSITRHTNGTGANSGAATKLWADDAVRTDVHNANHEAVLSVAAGTAVHDKVFVTKLAGTPASVPSPTGNVVFHRYSTIGCTGSSVDQTVAIAADGTAETSPFTPTSDMSYRADYQGNVNYPARSGACEPLAVTSTPPPPPPSNPSNPHIAITKSPKEQSVTSGSTAAWTIVVTNDGNVMLSNVRVLDPEAADCAKTSANIAALASMAPGASVTFTCTRANVTASFTNIATGIGTPPSGADVTASDSAHVTVTAPLTPPTVTKTKSKTVTVKKTAHPAISIVKSPNSQTVAMGGTATFAINVTNTGDVTLEDVKVTDKKVPSCNRTFNSMAAHESRTFTCAKTNTRVNYTNVAKVVGTPPFGPKVRDADSALVKAAPLKPPTKPKVQPKPKPKPKVVSHAKPKATG